MKATGWIAAGSLLAMGLVGAPITDLRPVVAPESKPAGLDAHESYAAASLLGQFRTSMSAWLWLRTDLYLHNGVEMRVMTEAERQAGRTVESERLDGNEKLDKDVEVTVVPPKSLDFRGIYGDVERAISAYRDMHEHTHNDPMAALPLFRLMTWMDPNFIPAWTNGAQIIAREHTEQGTKKALDFLHQGEVLNPTSIEILDQIAYTYLSRKRDIDHAIPYLERARKLGRASSAETDEDGKIILADVYRWLTLCYRDSSDRRRQEEVAREGLRFFKGDPVLTELLNPPPAILTKQGLRAWRTAHTSKTTVGTTTNEQKEP